MSTWNKTALILAVLALTAIAVGCSDAEPNAVTKEQATKEAVAVLGPDVCKIQIWGAEAYERANGRKGDRAALDRMAWNMAQFRIAQTLSDNPTVDKEVAIKEAMDVITEVYQTPSLAKCQSP